VILRNLNSPFSQGCHSETDIRSELKFLQKKSQRSTVIFYIFKKVETRKVEKRRFFVDFSAARGRSGLTREPVLPRAPTNIPTKFDQNRPKDG
jgi:hypothetical protein